MSSKLALVGNVIYWLYERFIFLLIYVTTFIIITGITITAISALFGDSFPKGGWPVIVLLVLSSMPGIAFFYWQFKVIRWRVANPEHYSEEKAVNEAARIAADEKAESALSNPFWSVIERLFYLALVIGGIYVAYLVVSSLPVSAAIILGAMIIGFCILALKS